MYILEYIILNFQNILLEINILNAVFFYFKYALTSGHLISMNQHWPTFNQDQHQDEQA